MDAPSTAGRNSYGESNGSARRPPSSRSKRRGVAAGTTSASPQSGIREQLRSPRFWMVVISVWLGVLFLEELLLPRPAERLDVPYTVFKHQVASGNVVDVTGRADTIQGDFKVAVVDPSPAPGTPAQKFTKFATNIPSFADTE